MRPTGLARAAVVLASLLVFAACNNQPSVQENPAAGGSGAPAVSGAPAPAGSSAAAYAKSVCGAMSDWLTAIKNSASSLGQTGNLGSTKDVKKLLLDYFDGLVKDTDTLIATVKSAGAPDVEGGAEVQAGFLAGFTKVRDEFASTRDKIAGLPTKDSKAFGQALQGLGATLQGAATQIGASLQGQTNPALDAAFAAEQSCASVAAA